MSDLTFIKNLPSEFTGYHLLPANTRYPCDWGYTEVKQVYRILQLIGNGEYIFLVTDDEFSYWGHSDKFETANKLGQDYKEQTVQNTIKMIHSQVKQIVKNFPHYLGDCLIVNNCTESVFNILRIELLLAGQIRYIDLIVDRDSNKFLGLGGTADTTIDFRVSINMCKTLSLVAYMKEAF